MVRAVALHLRAAEVVAALWQAAEAAAVLRPADGVAADRPPAVDEGAADRPPAVDEGAAGRPRAVRKVAEVHLRAMDGAVAVGVAVVRRQPMFHRRLKPRSNDAVEPKERGLLVLAASLPQCVDRICDAIVPELSHLLPQ